MDNKNKSDEEFNRMIETLFGMLERDAFKGLLNLNDDIFNVDSLDKKTRKGRTKEGNYFEESTWTSPDGKSSFSSLSYTTNSTMPIRGNSMPQFNIMNDSAEGEIEAKIQAMEDFLPSLIEKEDFETAAKLRDKIAHLKLIEPKFIKLRKQLITAVEKEDFGKAQSIKEKVQKLLINKK